MICIFFQFILIMFVSSVHSMDRGLKAIPISKQVLANRNISYKNVLINEITKAEKSLTIVIDKITSDDNNGSFWRELRGKLLSNNIKIDITTKKSEKNNNYLQLLQRNYPNFFTVTYLEDAQNSDFFHDKYFIVDDKKVILTSNNLTFNGLDQSRNSESFMVLEGEINGLNVTDLFNMNTVLYKNSLAEDHQVRRASDEASLRAYYRLFEFYKNYVDSSFVEIFLGGFQAYWQKNQDNVQFNQDFHRYFLDRLTAMIESAKSRIIYSQYNLSDPTVSQAIIRKLVSNKDIQHFGVLDSKNCDNTIIYEENDFFYVGADDINELFLAKGGRKVASAVNNGGALQHDKVMVIDNHTIFSTRNFPRVNGNNQLGTTIIIKNDFKLADYFIEFVKLAFSNSLTRMDIDETKNWHSNINYHRLYRGFDANHIYFGSDDEYEKGPYNKRIKKTGFNHPDENSRPVKNPRIADPVDADPMDLEWINPITSLTH